MLGFKIGAMFTLIRLATASKALSAVLMMAARIAPTKIAMAMG